MGTAQSGLLWTIVRLPDKDRGLMRLEWEEGAGETQSMASVTHRDAEGKARIVKY